MLPELPATAMAAALCFLQLCPKPPAWACELVCLDSCVAVLLCE